MEEVRITALIESKQKSEFGVVKIEVWCRKIAPKDTKKGPCIPMILSSYSTIFSIIISLIQAFTSASVCLAIASSSLVGTHKSATLLPSFEIIVSLPLTLFFSESISVPR